jgi:hypothetical protein
MKNPVPDRYTTIRNGSSMEGTRSFLDNWRRYRETWKVQRRYKKLHGRYREIRDKRSREDTRRCMYIRTRRSRMGSLVETEGSLG